MITTTLPDICANAKESSGYIQTGEEFLREIEADFANSSRNQPVKPANITQIPTFHFECYEDDIPHQSVSFNSIDQNLLTAEMRDVSNLLYSPLPHQSSTFNHPTLIRLGESHPFPFTPYIPWSPTMYTPPVFSTSAEFLLHPSPIFNLETAANQIFPSLLAVDPGLDSLLSDFHFSDELDLFLVGTSNNDALSSTSSTIMNFGATSDHQFTSALINNQICSKEAVNDDDNDLFLNFNSPSLQPFPDINTFSQTVHDAEDGHIIEGVSMRTRSSSPSSSNSTETLPSPMLKAISKSFDDLVSIPAEVLPSATVDPFDLSLLLQSNNLAAPSQPAEQKLQQQHQQPKKPKPIYPCPFPNCTREFDRLANQKTHLLTHTKTRAFICDLCNSDYTTKSRLIIHMRGHWNQFPYVCDVAGCGYRAKQKCSLTTHAVKHLDVDAKREYYLEQRRRKGVECLVCGRMYKSRESLNQHSWREHGKQA